MLYSYHLYEMQQAMLTPARLGAELTRMAWQHPLNPMAYTQAGRTIAANAELFERITRRFGKPSFGLNKTHIDGKRYDVEEVTVAEKPFCNLIHFFRRHLNRHDPRVLVVAPMSGHHATLLRGTVEALLPHHNVYITDWIDARQVPEKHGRFNLDDYICYIRKFLSLMGPDTHVIAVCQPAVPVYAAISLMEAENDPNTPLSMTLMGGPIDTDISKTAVTELAETRPLEWFEKSVVSVVPAHYPGAHRAVYPGFIQLGGFMSMNLDRHVGSHMEFYQHLVNGDGDSAAAHRKFYNEYLSVMDITAEFYLQTVETVFQKQLLPKGKMTWHDPLTNQIIPVDPGAIKRTALLTVEGELDDISALGQTSAAHTLARNLDPNKKFHHLQRNVGHYGIFNGRRWREFIMPRIRHFIRSFEPDVDPVPEADLKGKEHLKPEKWDAKKHNVNAVLEMLAKEHEKAKKADSSAKDKAKSGKPSKEKA